MNAYLKLVSTSSGSERQAKITEKGIVIVVDLANIEIRKQKAVHNNDQLFPSTKEKFENHFNRVVEYLKDPT